MPGAGERGKRREPGGAGDAGSRGRLRGLRSADETVYTIIKRFQLKALSIISRKTGQIC